MQVVLYEPEIPPNTGNIARLCAAMGCKLHLIEPLGFKVDDKHLKRAGCDYWEFVDITYHKSWQDFLAIVTTERLVLASAKQGVFLDEFTFQEDDFIVMGPETRGLPKDILALSHPKIRIPSKDVVRSLNLSTATGMILSEGLRQTNGFPK